MSRRHVYILIRVALALMFLASLYFGVLKSGLFWSDEDTTNKTAVMPDSLAHQTGRRLPNMVLNPPDSIGPLDWSPQFAGALMQSTLYLIRESTRQNPMRTISKADLLSTIHLLEDWQELTPSRMYELFDFYEIQTIHKGERVKFTGYYTPTIQVSRKPNAKHVEAFLRRPQQWEGSVPSSQEIYDGALLGKGLEIGWCQTRKELLNAQMQGSCVVVFPDGKKKFLGFDGTNHTLLHQVDSTSVHTSPDRIREKAYVFFKERDTLAWGAAGFPLTPGYSIAVDQRVLPLGACFLARLAFRDSTGRLQQVHRILLAQDTGGSIQGTGHVDLYCGEGPKALETVRQMHSYGRLWLLLPRKEAK